MITINEQILQAKRNIKSAVFFESKSLDVEKAILASLERLKAIESVQVPDEKPIDPNKWAFDKGLESY